MRDGNNPVMSYALTAPDISFAVAGYERRHSLTCNEEKI